LIPAFTLDLGGLRTAVSVCVDAAGCLDPAPDSTRAGKSFAFWGARPDEADLPFNFAFLQDRRRSPFMACRPNGTLVRWRRVIP
jgi:hypothetical protein